MRRVIESSKNPDDELCYDQEMAGPSPDESYLDVPTAFLKPICRVIDSSTNPDDDLEYDPEVAGPSDSSIAANLGVTASFLKHMRRVIESSTNQDDDLEYDSEVADPSPDTTYLVVPRSFFKHIWRVKANLNNQKKDKPPSLVKEPGRYDVYIPAPAAEELDWEISGLPYSIAASHDIQPCKTRDEVYALKTRREARPSRFGPLLPTRAPSSIAARLGVPTAFLKHTRRVIENSTKLDDDLCYDQEMAGPSPDDDEGPYDLYVPAPAFEELDWQIAGKPYSLMAGLDGKSSKDYGEPPCSLATKREAKPSRFGLLLPTPAPSSPVSESVSSDFYMATDDEFD
ncbi:hypothetical protein N7528_000864 [Penicillium herquei]|nr:hypothetical protein N7528_000864 [Penicillium herquei]